MKKIIKSIVKKHKEVLINFFWRCLQVFGRQGITFLIFFMSAKLLTPYEFGVYNYVLAFIFLLIMFCDFGISTATSKFVAEYSVSDREKLKAVLFNSGLVISFLSFIIIFFVIIFGQLYFKDKFVYVLYLLPLIFLSPMASLYDGIYRGLKKFKILAICSLAIGIISLVFVSILIKNFGLIGALIAQNLFYLLTLLGLILMYREFNWKFNKHVIKEIGLYSFIYGIAILGNYLFIRFGTLILGGYGYIKEVALYELVNRIFMLLLYPFTLFGQVVAPNFAILFAKKEYSSIYKKSIKYTILFLVIGIIFGITLYLFLPMFFQIFFNEYYIRNDFSKIFLLCLIMFISNVWAATFDAGILIPTGGADLMAKFYVILGIFGVVLSLVLFNFFGYMGVIFASTISCLLMTIGLRIIYFFRFFNLKNIPESHTIQ